eukprot:5684889-Amphidinium_carterae.1
MGVTLGVHTMQCWREGWSQCLWPLQAQHFCKQLLKYTEQSVDGSMPFEMPDDVNVSQRFNDDVLGSVWTVMQASHPSCKRKGFGQIIAVMTLNAHTLFEHEPPEQ